MADLSILVAFIAGILSFLSPCIFPIIPAYILFITGLTFKDISDNEFKGDIKRKTLLNSLFFILGFSLVFILLGLTASFIGNILVNYLNLIRIIGGIIVVLFGLYFIGVLKLSFLGLERKIHFAKKPAGYFGSFLVGIAFGAAWTPCVGPILGSILVLAATKSTLLYGAFLLAVYSLGLAVPFIITSLTINTALKFFSKTSKHLRAIEIATGLFLIMLGIFISLNFFDYFSTVLIRFFS